MTFVAGISIVSALLLAITAETLRERIKANERTDVKKRILESFQILPNETTAEEVDNLFSARIKILLVDWKNNLLPVPDNLDVTKLTPWKEDAKTAKFPIYALKSETSDTIDAYSIPIWGRGLWGPIYGYLALDATIDKVLGVTFAAPKETPGLGAEIQNETFRKRWIGKKIFDENLKLTPIQTVKGKATDKYGSDKAALAYHVDGISGATLTCNGVNDMLKDSLIYYENYLRKLKGEHK